MSRLSGVSSDFPVQLATRLRDWSDGGLLRCNAARFYVCRVVLQYPRARHARCGQVASILVASSFGTFDTPDFLVTCWRHPREDVTSTLRLSYEETTSVEFKLKSVTEVIYFRSNRTLNLT